MQKDLEESLNKYALKYSIDNPKAKQVEYNIEGIDGSVSITIYRNYGNNFGKFYLYVYSDKLKPKTQTATLKDKNQLDNILKLIKKTFNIMSLEQAALKKEIDDLSNKLEDVLYMYGDSDEEQQNAMNTSKFKSLDKKLSALKSKYEKKYKS